MEEDFQPDLSIVTATFNGLEWTRTYLETLRKTLDPGVRWECVLVDDGSTDGTREYIRSLAAPFRILYNQSNRGFAGANNRGAREAKAPLLLFLNNDLRLEGDWLAPMMREIRAEKVGCVGNVQRAASHGRIDHAGVIFNPVGIPEHYGKDYPCLRLRGSRGFRAVTAACWLIRRDLFLERGGFDEGFSNGLEDIDFCLRLGQLGYRHRVALESQVFHRVSASPGRKDRELDNQRRFLERWGAQTRGWGRQDWPMHYIRRNLRWPWRLNGPKTLQALVRICGFRRQNPPAWAVERISSLEAAFRQLEKEDLA